MAKTAPASVRLEPALNDRVTAIAAAFDRPRSWVIEQAVRDFVAVQEWQLAAIDAGLSAADTGRVVAHDDVVAWVRLRIPMNSAGDSGVMSATHSNRSRPVIPIDVGRGGVCPWAS